MTRLAPLLPLLLSACATVPSAPADEYRALGTEPFWGLRLTGRQMIFTTADGQRVIEPQPRAIHGFAGDIFNGRRIHLNIVHGGGCSDGMSDRTYRDTVQVDVDGKRWNGCGGDASELQPARS